MRPEVKSAVSGVMAAAFRTADGRSVRHAAERLDAALAGDGWSPEFRRAYLAACQQVADRVMQRGKPAASTRRARRTA